MPNVTVIADTTHGRAVLTCPIPLPTVLMFLKYSIVWERIDNSIPVRLIGDPESYGYRLLQNNKSLSLSVSKSNDQRVYRCKLTLTRCNITAINRCAVPPIIGPNMRFNVLGKAVEEAGIKDTSKEDKGLFINILPYVAMAGSQLVCPLFRSLC